MNKFLIIFFMSILLIACANTTYKVPKADPSNKQKLATVCGNSERKGFYTWQNSQILSIDNKDVSYGFKSKTSYKIPVTAKQEHTFVINTQFNRSFSGGGPYVAMQDLKAKLEPGMDYKVKEAVDGAKVNVWLENLAGKRISSISSAPYSANPINTVVIPILMR